MYVIMQNNRLVVGPVAWNVNFLTKSLERINVFYNFPSEPPTQFPFKIDNNVFLYKSRIDALDHNPKIQRLIGPYWTFENDIAVGTYVPADRGVEEVKKDLKDRVASVRYKKESSLIKITIQNVEVEISTDRNSRSVYFQKLNSIADDQTVNWKFNADVWLQLTKTDLTLIINGIDQYIQSCFDEEYTKVQTIEQSQTLTELDSIILGDEPVEENLNPPE